MIWLLIDSSSVGGAERHVAALAQGLERRQIDASVVLYGDHGSNPWLRQLEAAGLRSFTLDNSIAGLLARMRQDQPILIHTHGYKAGILGRVAARWLGVPVVSTFHSGERGAYRVWLYDALDEWTSFLGQRIVVSEAIRQRLPFSSVVIPSFVQCPKAPTLARLPRRIGFVGRLSYEKGPDIFCQIAQHAPAGLEWHVFGDGPMRADLENAFGGKIHFHGIIADMEVVWATLGLLLMPSRSEGLPLAALEALAHGVPVIASRIGGLACIVREDRTGWLFDPDQPLRALDHMARWLTLEPATEAALRQACWAHVRDQFSERRLMPELLAVYRAAGVAVEEAPAGRQSAAIDPRA